MRIKVILPQQTFPVRQAVLRPGKSLEACVFEGDEQPESFHLGAYENDFLMGVVSLMHHKNPIFQENKQFQLRGMAILPEFQNRKIGTALIKSAEEKLLAKKTTILWCNARESAVKFYEKHGFERLGEGFEIPAIGPHFLLCKKLEA